MRQATEKQLQVRNVIRSLIEQNGYPPSIREVADYIGLSPSTVFNHLAALQRKGLIRVDKGKQRALVIVDA